MPSFYWFVAAIYIYIYKTVSLRHDLTYIRQMKGEDLQGLDIEQLKQLENALQGGLSRVLEIKV